MGFNWIYPLVKTNIAGWKIPELNGGCDLEKPLISMVHFPASHVWLPEGNSIDWEWPNVWGFMWRYDWEIMESNYSDGTKATSMGVDDSDLRLLRKKGISRKEVPRIETDLSWEGFCDTGRSSGKVKENKQWESMKERSVYYQQIRGRNQCTADLLLNTVLRRHDDGTWLLKIGYLPIPKD